MKPRTLLFDLFGDHLRYLDAGAGPGSLRLRSLVDLLAIFGVGESATRVALARMRREGWFDAHRDGRESVYRLTGRTWRLLDDGRTRIFRRSADPWDGAWRTVIYAVPESVRPERETLRRTLSWHGFGPLTTATWLSPHDRLDALADALGGLTATRLDLLTSRARSRDADRGMAARCWDLDALGRSYAEWVTELEQVPSGLIGPEALRVRLALVARARTFTFLDPDLPAELLPAHWPGGRAHDLFGSVHAALRPAAEDVVVSVVGQHSGRTPVARLIR